MVYATQDSCPLTVKVTLHVPEHFVADGESIAVVVRQTEGLATFIPAFDGCNFLFFKHRCHI